MLNYKFFSGEEDTAVSISATVTFVTACQKIGGNFFYHRNNAGLFVSPWSDEDCRKIEKNILQSKKNGCAEVGIYENALTCALNLIESSGGGWGVQVQGNEVFCFQHPGAENNEMLFYIMSPTEISYARRAIRCRAN